MGHRQKKIPENSPKNLLLMIDYTQRHVYHIKTNDKNYLRAHNAIKSIMNDGSWERGEWEMWNDQQPSMENALHTYHEFKYNEELGVYVYTFIRPYDD